MREEKYYKINKKKKICILLVSILVLIKKNNGYAAITVGGSMMQGINIMMGFSSTMYINSNEGMAWGWIWDLVKI